MAHIQHIYTDSESFDRTHSPLKQLKAHHIHM